MKLIWFLGLALALGGILGCAGLTPEQQAKLDAASKKNEELLAQLETIRTAAKEGKLNPIDAFNAITAVTEQVKANYEVIKSVKAEAGSGSTVAVLFGLFGRSALHLLNTLPVSQIPVAGPFLQFALTLAMGGSESKYKMANTGGAGPGTPVVPPAI